tara:strand:+ start:1199 stop:1402 length:204 start_codon:yes stop_codon:yes gene_type:complete
LSLFNAFSNLSGVTTPFFTLFILILTVASKLNCLAASLAFAPVVSSTFKAASSNLRGFLLVGDFTGR